MEKEYAKCDSCDKIYLLEELENTGGTLYCKECMDGFKVYDFCDYVKKHHKVDEELLEKVIHQVDNDYGTADNGQIYDYHELLPFLELGEIAQFMPTALLDTDLEIKVAKWQSGIREQTVFEQFNPYNNLYNYNEMKVMTLLGYEPTADDLDYEDLVRIASAVAWHWDNGYELEETPKYEKNTWLLYENKREFEDLSLYAKRTLPLFIDLYLKGEEK